MFLVDAVNEVWIEGGAMSTLIRWIKRVEARLRPTVIVATASTAITTDQARFGAVVSNQGASGAVTFSLPAAEKGMRVTALVQAAQELRLDPSGTETIGLPATGVQQAAGKYVTADAVGESLELVCLVDGTWTPIGGADGTWTAEA